jgi:protein required for attachment to host cells
MQQRLATHLHFEPDMYRVCIALVDASRARLFTFEHAMEAARSRDELVERNDLVNPQRRSRPSELFSEPRPGASRSGHLQYAFDDHRDRDVAQLDDKFARMAMAALRELIDERPTQRVVVSASPRMLGRLRAAAPGLLPDHIALDELPRDLVKLSPTDVRTELASRGLLPSRAEPPASGW